MKEVEYFDDTNYEPYADVEDDIDGHYEANYADANLHKTFGMMSIAKSEADIRKVISTMKNKAASPSSSRELVPFVLLENFCQQRKDYLCEEHR